MNKLQKEQLIYSIITVIVGIAVILYIAQSNLSSKPKAKQANKNTYKGSKQAAWERAKQYVKFNLKSPGSADFGGLYEQNYKINVSAKGSVYTVRGWVDSQNGFGALIRTNFKIKLEYKDEDWKIISGPEFY